VNEISAPDSLATELSISDDVYTSSEVVKEGPHIM
jgi:hypothetical protein